MSNNKEEQRVRLTVEVKVLSLVLSTLRDTKILIGDGSRADQSSDMILSYASGDPHIIGQCYEALHTVYHGVERSIVHLEDLIAQVTEKLVALDKVKE